MFDVGWSELLVIAVVALVVIGPKELPATLRTIGKMTARARKVAGEFRAQFDEAMREAELDDVRQTISDAQKLNPVNSLREAMNPLRQMGNEIKADLQRSTPAAVTSTPAEPVSEPSTGLPEMPPIVPAASEAAPVVSPAPVTPPAAVAEVPAKPKAVRKPRAKAPVKADEVAAALVDTSVVAEKPKRAPRKVAAATSDAPAAAAPKKRPTAGKTTPKKKDQA
ncbi:Sec-independent protein translocase protein TatB [Rhizobium sp. CB3090]|uniref:Sec-independent protein translocase protein TatB n=1 Tax=Rhizobium sp. CB3090 TaxID=3039156 RepID=UPI0024B0D901|nr:Sec-independent protein translocase protein TatB [Rhizobium sp. CB3090]WFU10413.1 Sec-independent protein translocase protein TatB [Rhizobium sp. CB3090]